MKVKLTIKDGSFQKEALDTALTLGATVALPGSDLEKELVDKPQNEPIGLVIDCVGVQTTFDLAQRLASPGGRIVVIGLQNIASDLHWHVGLTAFKELKLLMNCWGTKSELKEVLDLIKEGKLKPVVEEKSMDDLLASVKAMEEGAIKGRLAFIPVS